MKTFTSLGRVAALLLFLVLAGVGAQSARAQGMEGATITGIDVSYVGPQTVSKERVLANMRLKVGTAFSEARVEEDIRGLYATGKVQNVRIFGTPSGAGVRVQVILATRALVTAIEFFEGGKRVRIELDTNGQRRVDNWAYFDPAPGPRIHTDRAVTGHRHIGQT